MNKTYILQKDLPDAKALDMYYYNGSGHYLHMTNPSARSFVKEYVENNPEWFKREDKDDVCGIPPDAKDIEVFHIKDKEAFIGFKISNGDFHFISVPYNPKPKKKKFWYDDLFPKSQSDNADKLLHNLAEDKLLTKIQEENKPDWEASFKKVLKTLKENKVMVDTRWDGIYIRLAGNEDKGEAFTLHWTNAYPFNAPQPQKEEQKDWEVVAYGKPGYTHTATLWECQENNCPILSVKRLSDGEVFTVGDVIEFNVGGVKSEPIEKFEVDYFNKTKISAYSSYAGRTFPSWKKVTKIPLFVTEDLKEIYKGDKVWLLSTDLWYKPYEVIAPSVPFTGYKNQFKYFSTKEAAEEYVINNKPCLSLVDVSIAYGTIQQTGISFDARKTLHRKLKEQVKTKL